jgi:hypothetical protein
MSSSTEVTPAWFVGSGYVVVYHDVHNCNANANARCIESCERRQSNRNANANAWSIVLCGRCQAHPGDARWEMGYCKKRDNIKLLLSQLTLHQQIQCGLGA